MNPKVTQQSPIELPDGIAADNSNSMFYMYPLLGDPVKLTNNGNALVFTLPQTYKGGFGLANKPEEIYTGTPPSYRLWHVTFHSPSEHTRNGLRMPLEVQLAHKEANTGKLAIVSVFFTDGGQPHSFLNVMLEFGLPQNGWDEVFVNRAASPPSSVADKASKSDKIIDFYSLVEKAAFFSYEGSLTIPPCSPEVQWLVRSDAIVADAQQITAFTELLKTLNPPFGNFRTAQPTGSREVKLIAAQDINDPKNLEIPISPAEPAKSSTGETVDPNTEISTNPEFSKITGEESPELLAAKRNYQEARLSAEAAKVAYIKSKAALGQVQNLYDKAPGIVEKIDLKWVLIDKTNDLNAKTVGMVEAMKKYKAALDGCVAVVGGAKADAVPTTTPVPTEAGSSDVATTRLPTEHPPVPTALPGMKLPGTYKLASGAAGNPFVRNAPETSVSIGGDSGQAQYFPHLNQNLQQPEGSIASVPVPSLVKVTTTTVPPLTTAPPVEIDLKLNVPKSSISDMDAFKEGLATGLASSSGVDASRVIIEDVTKTTSSVLLQKRMTTGLRKSRHHNNLITFDSAVSPREFLGFE